jgi:hypothetical protein
MEGQYGHHQSESIINLNLTIDSEWSLHDLMPAEWGTDRYLKSGRLVQVLPQFHTPDADLHAV